MFRHHLARWLPSEDALRQRPGLRWLAPLLAHPGLWRPTRRRIAAGAAIGVFFGLLIPVAQIAAAAGVAVLLRANLPVAAVATLVSNPLTYVPLWVAAHQAGAALLDEPAGTAPAPPDMPAEAAATPGWWARVTAVGAPLALGLAVFAVVGVGTTWLLIHVGWKLAVRLRRRHRPPPARA
ncbi:MAG: DUF2062 domain-containing protein [Betaproteobacteria bacterium]